MKYNEKLMNSSIMGDDDALDELKFNAGSGDCEAQYYLAMYYANICGHVHDPDYHYWIEKSKENGFMSGVGKPYHNDDGSGLRISMVELKFLSHLITLFSLL